MARFKPDSSLLLVCVVLLVLCIKPTTAFGAGNIASISKIEGTNWRHGDIEDTLLTILMSRASNKKFSKLDVKRVYFGNWLRDYSQAVDVGALKMVSAEAIRLLLWILGFMSFGYGTREFEVTAERLGCYRPEEHIDNPKDYADNEDARRYDRRLRGPVDERRELAIDERTGLKMYIASEDQGITTSAGLVRDLYRRCIDLGRRARRSRNDTELYEAFRLMGTANHCLEDYSAHSNFVELCLIEMGEHNVFPHVGRSTKVHVRGAREPIWPLITGTFGGVDFLHSVMGELNDKASQSEIEELEGTICDAENNRQSSSIIQGLLDKLPSGILGGGEKEQATALQQNANNAKMEQMQISPKNPEEFTKQAENLRQQIYPVLEFHDNIMREITETIDKIPILPELLESFQEQLNVFVFSLIAPFMLPLIKQVKAELNTGSSEIIESSRRAQHIVFEDDRSSDPTHSMISKDHFSNVLNEPAGKVASAVIGWVVPQIVECWDDERVDAERTINRIINGVFHHPALRNGGDDGARDVRSIMFSTVERWWGEQRGRAQDELRDKLSREGVEQGRNHKEGVQDKGHGCGKPLGMPNIGTASSSGAIGGVLGAGVMGALNQASGGGGRPSGGYGGQSNPISQDISNKVGEAVGGGLLGSIAGGIIGGVGGSLLGGGSETKNSSSYQSSYGQDNSYTQTQMQSSYQPPSHPGGSEQYGQSQYSRTDYPGGGRMDQSSYQQTSSYGGVSSYQQESRHESQSGSNYRQESSYGESIRPGKHEKKYKNKSDDDDVDSNDENDYEKRAKKERKKREKEEKKYRKEQEYAQYGGGGEYRRKDSSDDDDNEKKYKKKHGSDHHHSRRDHDDEHDNRRHHHGHEREERSEGYGGGRQEYGGGRQEYGGGHQEYGGGRQEYGSSGYGAESRREEYGSSGHGSRREEYGSSGYGESRSSGYGQSGSYGSGADGYGRRDDNVGGYGGGRRDDDESGGYGGGYGGRRNDDEDDGGYNNRRRRNDEDEGGYGGNSGYGDSGYGESGGYGGDRY